jgi:prepilin-type N-terminal cleavage/methylation domain-containing protein
VDANVTGWQLMMLIKPPVKQAAFSLLELIVTILIIGILSAVVSARFSGNDSFESRAAAGELILRLKYAQQLAMNNTSRVITVSLAASQLTIAQDGVVLSDYPFNFNGPYDVTFSDANFTYDSLGNTTASTISLTPSNGVTVCVESSGYARLC